MLGDVVCSGAGEEASGYRSIIYRVGSMKDVWLMVSVWDRGVLGGQDLLHPGQCVPSK